MTKFHSKALAAQADYDKTRKLIKDRLTEGQFLVNTIYRKLWRRENHNSYRTDEFAWALTPGEINVLEVTPKGVRVEVIHR